MNEPETHIATLDDFRCENCHRLFDLNKANIGRRIIENTFTGLKDLENPWVECPHCGFKSE